MLERIWNAVTRFEHPDVLIVVGAGLAILGLAAIAGALGCRPCVIWGGFVGSLVAFAGAYEYNRRLREDLPT